jgi:hypothetical protein
MKKMIFVILVIIFASCTQNYKVKKFGGSSEILLDAGEKLEMIAWKESSLWLQTRPFRESETPEIHYFKQKSSLGIVEGQYIIRERK